MSASFADTDMDNGLDVIAASHTDENIVWHENSLISVIDHNDKPVLPENFALYQNYPNPFNPTTTIKFDLPKQSYVELKLYDILGKKVKTIISENKPAGSYKYILDGSDLVSGLYFIKMQVGKFHALKKVLLVK